MPSSAFIIAGRTIKDYAKCGHVPAPDVVLDACIFCGDALTLTPEGAAKLADERTRGHQVCGAICTPCALLHVPRITEIQSSAHGREQLKHSPAGRAIHAEMLRRMVPKP